MNLLIEPSPNWEGSAAGCILTACAGARLDDQFVGGPGMRGRQDEEPLEVGAIVDFIAWKPWSQAGGCACTRN